MRHPLCFPVGFNPNKLVPQEQSPPHGSMPIHPSHHKATGSFRKNGQGGRERNQVGQWHVCHDSQQKPGPFTGDDTLNATGTCKKSAPLRHKRRLWLLHALWWCWVPNGPRVRKKKKSHLEVSFVFCRNWILFSSFSHQNAWTSFLSKRWLSCCLFSKNKET